MSMKKAGTIVSSLILLLIIVVVAFRSCSISKKDTTTSSSSSTSSSTSSIKGEDSNREVLDNDSTSGNKDVDVINKEVSNNGNIDNINKKEEPNNDSINSKDVNTTSKSTTLVKVDEPSLSKMESTKVLVSSKGVFKLDNIYLYSLGLIFPKETGEGYSIINYYCSKKTYDAISKGDTVIVNYQLDGNSNISISSIALDK